MKFLCIAVPALLAFTAGTARADWVGDARTDIRALEIHISTVESHYAGLLPAGTAQDMEKLKGLLKDLYVQAGQGRQVALPYFSNNAIDGWFHAVDVDLLSFTAPDAYLNGSTNHDGYTRLTAYEYTFNLLETCLSNDSGNDGHEAE